MRWAQYRNEGDVYMRHTPVADVAAGTPVEIATGYWGVSPLDVQAGEPGDFRVTGVFQGVKTTESDVISEGDLLGYSVGNGFAVNGTGPWRAMESSGSTQSYVLVAINVPVPPGAGSGTVSNLGWNAATSTITNSGGASTILTVATTDDPGLMSDTHFDTLSFITVTQAVDLDAMELKLAGIENNADVTDEANVTAALDGATLTDLGAGGTTGDGVLIQDASDSNNLKKVLWENLPSGGGGGDMLASTYDPAGHASQVVTETDTQVLTNKTLSIPTLFLQQGTGSISNGRMQWHNANDTILVGDGSSVLVFSDDSVNLTANETNVTNALDGATLTDLGAGGTNGDGFLVQDASDSNNLKKILWENLPSGGASTLDALTDTNIIAVGSGEVLVWDGVGDWINNTLAEAGIAAVSHSHTASDVTDFDTEVSNNASVVANTAKLTADETNVTNALDGATLSPITGDTGDGVLVQDTSDSNNLKKVLWENLPGGGGQNNIIEATFTPGVSTPDVNGKTFIRVLNTSPSQTITDFLNPTAGQELTVQLPGTTNPTEIINGTNIFLNGDANFLPIANVDATLTLTYDGTLTQWVETGRSHNSHSLSVSESSGDLDLINTNNAALHLSIDNPPTRVASFGGTGMVLTGNGDITFNEIADHATTPSAGTGILWVNTSGQLIFTDGSATDTDLTAGAASTLAALSDTTITGPSEGEVLTYTSGSWQNSASGAGVTGTGANNQVSVWSGTSSQDGSTNMTFDGTTLAITGGITTTTTVAATGNVTGANLSNTNTGDEPAASATVAGIVELATPAETQTGTDTARAVTPEGIGNWIGTSTVTTLGTITTGTWSANISGATMTGNIDVGNQQIVSTSTNDIDLHSNNAIVMRLGDTAGAHEVEIRDSAGTQVASIDSDGNIISDEGAIAIGATGEFALGTSGILTPIPLTNGLHYTCTMSGSITLDCVNVTTDHPVIVIVGGADGARTIQLSNSGADTAAWFDGTASTITPTSGKLTRVLLEKTGTVVYGHYLEQG